MYLFQSIANRTYTPRYKPQISPPFKHSQVTFFRPPLYNLKLLSINFMQIIIVYDFLRISVLVYFPITLEKTRNKYRRPRFRERKPHFFFIVGFVSPGTTFNGGVLKTLHGYCDFVQTVPVGYTETAFFSRVPGRSR